MELILKISGLELKKEAALLTLLAKDNGRFFRRKRSQSGRDGDSDNSVVEIQLNHDWGGDHYNSSHLELIPLWRALGAFRNFGDGFNVILLHLARYLSEKKRGEEVIDPIELFTVLVECASANLRSIAGLTDENLMDYVNSVCAEEFEGEERLKVEASIDQMLGKGQ